MIKKQAHEIAKRVWGIVGYITMEQVGSGAYVQIPGDPRVHRLNHKGQVACLHDDCKEKERQVNNG